LRKPQMLANGFLRVEGFVTRVGVFEYSTPQGIRRELRSPDEVFHADSLASLEMVPVLDDHPYTEPGFKVTADNADRVPRVGHVGERIDHTDGEKVSAPMLITDKRMAEKLIARELSETSCGYECELDFKPGSYKGQRYDCVQRKIRYNHVAIVAQGRQGPDVAIRVDSKESTVEKIVRIDGKEYPAGRALVEAFARHEADHATAIEKLAKERDELKTEADKSKARVDAMEQEQKKGTDPKAVQAVVRARVELEKKCDGLVAPEKMAELTAHELRVAALAKLSPELKLDGKSEAYVEAAFDTTHALHAKSGFAAIREVLEGGKKLEDKADGVLSYTDARARHIKESRDAWKTPANNGRSASAGAAK
jgi:hypothetical protein